MPNYPKKAQETHAKLKAKGGAITFLGDAAPDYSPTTGRWAGTGQGNMDTFATVGDDRSAPTTFQGMRAALASSILLMVSAVGITRLPSGRMVWGRKQYSVKKAEPFSPDGVTVIFYWVLGN